MNVVESDETTWYVEKDKSWNLAAAIWYVKNDKCGWKWRNNLLICWEDKSWNLVAAIWYAKKDKYGWNWRNNLLICWEG